MITVKAMDAGIRNACRSVNEMINSGRTEVLDAVATGSGKISIGSPVICKGDWRLGTACGTCRRCIDTAPSTIRALIEEVRELTSQSRQALPFGEYYPGEPIPDGVGDVIVTVRSGGINIRRPNGVPAYR